MEEKFKNGVSIQNGQKYIGIYTALGNQSSIWGGVAKKDSACGKVKKGDILKAAGYGAYTLVGAGRRGNVLEGNFSVSWTGANYLQRLICGYMRQECLRYVQGLVQNPQPYLFQFHFLV